MLHRLIKTDNNRIICLFILAHSCSLKQEFGDLNDSPVGGANKSASEKFKTREANHYFEIITFFNIITYRRYLKCVKPDDPKVKRLYLRLKVKTKDFKNHLDL